MAKNKKPLLNEGTVRRMMKLANMEALGDGFITEKWGSKKGEYKRRDVDGVEKKAGDVDHHYKDYEGKFGGNKGDDSKTHPGHKDYVKEDEDYTAKKEKPGADKRKGAEKRGAEGTLAKTKGHGRVDYVNEERDEDELESELHATEDELSDMDSEADRERDELEADDADLEGEVTITDEEAQDIIDLADKLKGAVGDESEPLELELDAEEEIDIEEPGSRMYEEELYEAALKGLEIELVDDKVEQRKALVQEAKKRIYERVVRRLIAESKK